MIDLGTRIAVIGCGSIGLRHLRNLLSLGVAVTAIDTDPTALEAARALGVTTARSLVEARSAAVIVCTPATDHAATAVDALQRRMDVFVEKPLAVTVSDARTVRDTAARTDRILTVGYNLRYEAGLVALRSAVERGQIGRVLYARIEFAQYLPEWRPARDYRTTVSARKNTGGGILLEASHELDVLRWLFGDWRSVRAVTRTLSDLEIDVEDTVSAVIEMMTGVVVELHLDFVRPGYRRGVLCVGTRGTLEWDLAAGTTLSKAGAPDELLAPPSEVGAMYLSEMEAFLAAVRRRTAPTVTADDGIAALELVDAIRRASDTSSVVQRS